MTRTTQLALGFGLMGLLAGTALASDVTDQNALTAWDADPTTIFAAADVTLDDFAWAARPVVVFANSPRDPAFTQQMEFLAERPDDLVDRDVVIIVDTEPDGESALRTKLRPRGFMMVLIGKDGQVKLRKPLPWDVREISRSIDKMPLRKQEIRAGG